MDEIKIVVTVDAVGNDNAEPRKIPVKLHISSPIGSSLHELRCGDTVTISLREEPYESFSEHREVLLTDTSLFEVFRRWFRRYSSPKI